MLKVPTILILTTFLALIFSAIPLCYSNTQSNIKNTIPNESNIDIKFRNIESDQLTEIGQIWSIQEDNKGYLWFSGARGVVRFDGINHKTFRHRQDDIESIPDGYIPTILSTKAGQIWFATHKGLYRYDPSKEKFIFTPLSPNISVIWGLAEDVTDGSIWIGFHGRGIGNYNPITNTFREYPFPNDSSANQNQAEHIYAVIRDQHGFVWAGSGIALHRLDPRTGFIQSYSRENSSSGYLHLGAITSFCEDQDNNLWIGTVNGLYRYSNGSEQFTRYEYQNNAENSLGNNSVGDIVLDKQNRLWIMLDGGGINLYHPELDQFTRIYAKEGILGSFKNNSVRRGFVSKAGDLWLGYHPHGVSVSNRFGDHFKTFVHDPSDPESISSNTIHALVQAPDGDLWMGTEKGLNRINLNTGKASRYMHAPGNTNTLSAKTVLSVLVDSHGRVWAGTWGGGLNMYNPNENRFTHFLNDYHNPKSLPSDAVYSLLEANPEKLLVSTGNGLSVMDIGTATFSPINGINSGVEKILHFNEQYILAKDYHSLNFLDKTTLELVKTKAFTEFSDKIIDTFIDKDLTIWATTAEGLFSKNTQDISLNRIFRYDRSTQAHYGQIIKGDENQAWLGGSAGITAVDIPTRTTRIINSAYGIPLGSFTAPRAAIKLLDNRLAFGGSNGLVILDPAIATKEIEISKPIFTGLKVLDREVSVKDKTPPILRPIEGSDHIVLDYFQNIFTIEYSVLDFQIPTEAKFSIRLKGFDETWRNVGNHRFATYTNLHPGEYVFEVRLAEYYDPSPDGVASIKVTVLPPWWLTKNAFAAYATAIFLVLSLILYTIWNHFQRDRERRINQKLMDLDKIKDDFLAHTSHELRTPLNGIIGLTESIIRQAEPGISAQTWEKLGIIAGSGKRLNSIINDILDFAKLKNHNLSLVLQPVNFHSMVEEALTLFRALIGNKKINLNNNVRTNFVHFLADEQRLTQIMFNLIGNSLKFTEAGEISITANEEEDNIAICVSDTGCGIHKQDQEKIFHPFEQSSTPQTIGVVGTGLGLSVTRSLVELHGGTISVSSEPGKGSTFYFTIKKLNATEQKNSSSTDQSKEMVDKKLYQPKQTLRILIVDDDAVNRMVIQSILSKVDIEISECERGLEAIKRVKNEAYDLLLLDMMLPDSSGLQVCQQLRKTFTQAQLPIIILTGDTTAETVKKSKDAGANLVLHKPVSSEEIIAQIQTISKLKDQKTS